MKIIENILNNLINYKVYYTSIILLYILIIKQKRNKIIKKLNDLNEIKELTLKQSHEIVYNFMYYEFPFLGVKSLEYGLFKTYSIPSISVILVKTTEMEENMPKRYDDTDLILREIIEHPGDNIRSKLAIQRLNFLHGQYPISNNDYLYTLAVFIIEPIVWVDKYGYRKSHPKEKEAMHNFWVDIGSKMGIKNIPKTWEETAQWMEEYEKSHMKFHKNNIIIKNSTLKLFLSIFPSIIHPFGDAILSAFCPPRLRIAMGLSDPPFGLTTFLDTIIKLQAKFVKYFLLPRSKPTVRTPTVLLPSDDPNDNRPGKGCPLFYTYAPTYIKEGYRIDELGPEKYKSKREIFPLYPDITAPKK